MPSIFQYEFMLRALVGGALVGILAPILGTFVVLRRYSLIADTLAHVALMGVAIGMASQFLPTLTALAAAVVGAVVVERLRSRGKLPGDAALAVVLYGSLAVAIVVISGAGGFNVDLFSFLFGSILSVSPLDLWLLAGLTAGVVIFVAAFYVDLAQLAFDEELARVSGVRTDFLNLALAVLTGATITMSMRVVGVLLIGALLVIPVLTGMRLARGLRMAAGVAVAAGLVSASAGLTIAFYGDYSAGGAIVLTALALLLLSRLWSGLTGRLRGFRRQGQIERPVTSPGQGRPGWPLPVTNARRPRGPSADRLDALPSRPPQCAERSYAAESQARRETRPGFPARIVQPGCGPPTGLGIRLLRHRPGLHRWQRPGRSTSAPPSTAGAYSGTRPRRPWPGARGVLKR